MTSKPAIPDARPRRRTRRAFGAAAAASVLLVGVSACAGESGDDAGVVTDGRGDGGEDAGAAGGEIGRFEATAAYLQQSAEQSTSEGYRTELLISMTGEIDETAPPFMSGSVEGAEYHYVMDMAPMMEQTAASMGQDLPAEMAALDLTMEMAGDPETMYIRAPMLAALGADAAAPSGLAELGDGWGFVDMARLGEQLPTEAAAAMGGQGIDPRAVVEIIEGSEDVEDLGTSEVRGESVHGLSTEASMGDLLEASGQDPEALAEVAGTGGTEEAVEALYDLQTPISVWIDDDGYLRRLEFGWDLSQIAGSMGGGEAAGTAAAALGEIRYVMDMFDYGTTVEFEAPSDAVDVTDGFADLAQG